MRNIRIADPRGAGPGARRLTSRSPASRVSDWLLTIPVALLLPAVLLVSGTAIATNPRLALSPDSAYAASQVTVTGIGFPKDDLGILAWDGSTIGMPAYQAGGNGRFRVSFAVPAGATPGNHTLGAVSRGGSQQLLRASATELVRADGGSVIPSATTDSSGYPGQATPWSQASATPTKSPAATSVPTPITTLTPVGVATSMPTVPPPPTASPRATAVGTPAATAVPSTAPTPTAPSPSACPTSLQALVDAAPTASTLRLPDCVFHESVTIDKALVVVGPATVTGDGSRTKGVSITATNVTLDSLTVTNVANALQTGAVNASGVDNVTLRNVTATNSAGACISISNSSGSSVLNSLMSGCRQEGYHFSAVSNFTFAGNRVTGNNAARTVDPGWEAGGGKIANGCSGVTFSDNEVDHNGGPGIWFDIHCGPNVVISGNRVHDNWAAGIMYEISSHASISGNVVWHNAVQNTSPYAWGWGAGILLSSSNNVDVASNVVAWNGDGISVISQNRSDAPGPVADVSVHDNDVFGVDGWPASSQDYALDWLQDWSGVLFLASSNNRASANAFWYSTPEGPGRYGWGGTIFTKLVSYAATPGGAGSVYLAGDEASRILSNAGVPGRP